jgi:hypothetical protein
VEALPSNLVSIRLPCTTFGVRARNHEYYQKPEEEDSLKEQPGFSDDSISNHEVSFYPPTVFY